MPLRRDLADEPQAFLEDEVVGQGDVAAIGVVHIAMLDLAPIDDQRIDAAIAFIQAHKPHGKIYIHCALGYSRSVAVVAAYLRTLGNTLTEAVASIRVGRPKIVLPDYLYRT